MKGLHREQLSQPPPSAPTRMHYTRALFMEMDRLGLFGDDRVSFIVRPRVPATAA